MQYSIYTSFLRKLSVNELTAKELHLIIYVDSSKILHHIFLSLGSVLWYKQISNLQILPKWPIDVLSTRSDLGADLTFLYSVIFSYHWVQCYGINQIYKYCPNDLYCPQHKIWPGGRPNISRPWWHKCHAWSMNCKHLITEQCLGKVEHCTHNLHAKHRN